MGRGWGEEQKERKKAATSATKRSQSKNRIFFCVCTYFHNSKSNASYKMTKQTKIVYNTKEVNSKRTYDVLETLQ